MTSPAYSIDQDREVDAALVMMATAKVRRLLVCDERGHLTGVFSLADAEIVCPDNPRVLDLRRALSHRVRHHHQAGATVTLR
jgi:signal-transduction protein with cAMP-binding, CBS, and nucleotidyltransferase domain